jgi:leucine-rich repeat kinase 2
MFFNKGVWLDFELSVKDRSQYSSVLSYSEISGIAEGCGMYEKHEILQAVRFLKDLGSIQYFERTALKDKVVINPQVKRFSRC